MLWLKALHLISMVCWFAGLFYLPRLFVYHAMSKDEISNERFKIMERKLFYGIMSPSALATLIFGLGMAHLNWDYLKTSGWFHAKMLLVFLLFVYHDLCRRHMKKLASNENTKSHVYFRWFNEAPVVALCLIIVLAVVRPF